MTRRKKSLLMSLTAGLMVATMLNVTPVAHAGGFTSKIDDGTLPNGAALGTLDTGAGTFTLGDPSVSSGCGDGLNPLATTSRNAAIYEKKGTPTYPGVLDIAKYTFQAGKKLDGITNDPGFINAAVELCNNAPQTPTDIPAGYSDMTFYWVFQDTTGTGPQNSPQNVGTNCVPTRFNDLGPTSDQRISAFRYKPGPDTCEAVSSPTAELAQIGNGTFPKVQAKNTINNGPFTTRTGDHWYEFVEVTYSTQLVGTTPVLAGRWTFGNYEDYSAIYTSIDSIINAQQIGSTPNAVSYACTGAGTFSQPGYKSNARTGCTGAPGFGSYVATTKTIAVRVPYAPRLDNSPDDDLLKDEARTIPVVNQGDNLQFYAVDAFGTRQVGTPFPVCPFSPTYPNPQGNPVGLPGYPQNLPQADGGSFCRQGFVGLLSGVDWAPNIAFEGRQAPRSPGWAPNPRTTDTNWAQCQYPAGNNTFGATAAPVITVGGPVDLNQDDFWISPQYQTGPPVTEVQVPGTGNDPSLVINTVPQEVVTGKNVDCGYQRVSTGLHYNNPGANFATIAS